MSNWTEIRTAAHVARTGQVNAAARELGIHRATVIRHIDILEAEFGTKLFLRAPKGYTATDFGRKVLEAADNASDQFEQLRRIAKLSGEDADGEIVISSPDFIFEQLAPVVGRFIESHKHMRVRLLSTGRRTRLEYGEADIAFRVGPKPENMDYVVEKFADLHFSLFASDSYVDRMGVPEDENDMAGHIFLSGVDPYSLNTSFLSWMEETVPETAIRVRANLYSDVEQLASAGVGIAFLTNSIAASDPTMQQVLTRDHSWYLPIWRLTHVDLHRSAKIQTFLEVLNGTDPGPAKPSG